MYLVEFITIAQKQSLNHSYNCTKFVV